MTDHVENLREIAETLRELKAPAAAAHTERAAAELERLQEIVHFYADPQIYHAIAFLVDRPAGSFADDFSEDEETRAHGYDRPMPGKRAREALPADIANQ